MRISEVYAATIRAAACEVFGPDVVVRLFGSRADDAKRGGDIDLHVEAAAFDSTAIPRFRAELWKRLDEEQLDVIVYRIGDPDSWLDRAARRDGIVL